MTFTALLLRLLQLLISFTLVLTSIHVVNGAPATTGVVVIEIPDGQIQNPIPTKSGLSLFRATDVAGDDIFYVGSVGQNTWGSLTTDLFGTVKPVTITNSAGLTITGLPEASASQSSITSVVPESAIPTLSSIPPSFAFTTIDAKNHSVVNLGQIFTRKDGSTSTAFILSDISTSCLTTVNSQGSTVFETLGLFTRSNGSVATDTLSFVTDSSTLALYMAAAGRSSSTASNTTGYQIPATGASGTGIGPGAASMSETARSYNTSVKSAVSANSSSRNNSSLQHDPNTSLPTRMQTWSSRSINTLRDAMVSDTTALSPSLQSPRMNAALPMSIVQSTSATSQIASRRTSASPSTQRGLSWSHAAGGSGSTLGLLTPRATTTIARKSGMPSEDQASISASSTTGGSSTYGSAVGDLLLAAPSDATLAGSLIAALLVQQVPTITTVPPGMALQSITTKTKCSHAFAMATTTSSGSTVTTVVPKICHDDAAFLLFPGAAIPLLCTRALSLLGFLLRWICDPRTGVLIGVDDITVLPPGPAAGAGSAEGSNPDPDNDPQTEVDEPTNSRGSSGQASSTDFPSRGSSGQAASTDFPSTSRISSTMTTSASTAVARPYYLFGGVGDEDEVSNLLGALDSKYKALQPAIGSTPMSGADWVNINLTANEVAVLSPNPDVLLLVPYLSVTESVSATGNQVSTTASFSTLSSYPSTTVPTLSESSAFSESSSPSGLPKVKVRRKSPSHQIRETKLSARKANEAEKVALNKRDAGRNILAQYGSDKMPCPRDLAVISWAPGVPAVLDYPYLFLQSQGEDTWAILVSSGIESGHVVSQITSAFHSICED